MSKPASRPWFGWVVGLVVTLLGGLFVALGPTSGALERTSFDLPLAGHDTHAPTNAVLVYITDSVSEELGQPLNRPFNRTNHAALIHRLRRDGARLVVFDLLFHDPDPNPNGDATMLAVMRQRRDVIIGVKHTSNDNGIMAVREEVDPLPIYQQAGAGLGNTVFEPDGDGGVRRMPRPVETLGGQIPGLGGAALQALGAALPPVGKRHYLHYYGPPDRLPGVLYSDVLLGRVAPGLFRNKVVFVGARQTTSALGANSDMHPTPFTRRDNSRSSGVSIHATAFLNLLHREWFTRAPGWVMGLLLLAFAGGGAGLTFLSPLRAVLAASAAVAVLTVTAFTLARTQHIWFPWMALVAQAGIGLSWTVTYNGYRSHLERALLRHSIGKYVSPNRVNQILRSPEILRPGGEMREVSVMFTDIAGFSKVSQRKHPEDLVKLLNGYYEEAISAVHATDGVVIDLIGDAIFALWNAPETQADHAGRASRTALALHRKLLKFDEANDGAPLRTRVGLHRGPVCVGNVGSTQRFNYTAIGDAVNLASRLEGLNKQLGTDILATRDIQREVENSLTTRPVGQFRFKGFDKVAEVYELLDVETAPPWFGEFREALRYFQRREWDAAEAGFRKVGAARSAGPHGREPGDGPSEFYLKQIEVLRKAPPPEDWLGEIDLREK